MITLDDYAFAEKDDTDHWTVHLLTGDYKDVYIQYGSVKLISEEEGNFEDPIVKFEFNIVDLPADLENTGLDNDEDFCNHIGEVLVHIITDAFDSNDYTIGDTKLEEPDAD